MTETIHYTADVVAVTPDDHILLIERKWAPFEGQWALPGGHVDAGEHSRDAAVRELEEETGVRVGAGDLRPVGTWAELDRDPRGWYATDVYSVRVPADTPVTAGDDARDARWWPLDGLPQLAFDHAEIIAVANMRPLGAGRAGAADCPGGVFARYRTVAGATVDLRWRYTTVSVPLPVDTLAACTGCRADHLVPHIAGMDDPDEKARAWAQQHAETCRALPRLATT
ncbi:NUDIX hydrolase [Streptomyces chrestomyceticus]|uniref:NUDIX hydrolase n=1 Tax=Streptomyces chrestomyceticus TaxID=68185 RepID=UPI0033C5FE30